MIGNVRYRYTHEEYKELSKGIIGSLVVMIIGEKNYGVGVVLKHRRYHGEVHLNIAWLSSPHFRFKEERMFEWHNYERVKVISKAKRNIRRKAYDYKSENFGRKQTKG